MMNHSCIILLCPENWWNNKGGQSMKYKVFSILLIYAAVLLCNCSEKESIINDKVNDSKKADFIITDIMEMGITSYNCPYIKLKVKNVGNATGYNVACHINALNASYTIIDTATAYFAGLSNIKPGQSAQDDAIFFELKTHSDYSSLEYTMSWLTR